MPEFVRVCETSDVPPGTMKSVDIGDKKIMVVNVDGKFYAVSRVCTHETADLSTGFLYESEVTCPLHLSRFDVRTGTVQNAPATVPLQTYPVRIEGSGVYVEA